MTTRAAQLGRTRRHLPRAGAILIAAGATVAFGITPLPASAALSGLTDFEIDGNTVVTTAGNTDWASDPAWRELDGCNTNPDADRLTPGTKIDELALDAIGPIVNPGNVPGKTDLCSTYQAAEMVLVPTPDAGDDPAAGQYEFIFYGGWSRPNVNGEIDVLFPLLGADATTNADDLLISYDFVDSTNTTSIEILEWTGAAWASAGALPAGSFEAATDETGAVTEDNQPVTFGEFAINLTRSGILPVDGPCTRFSSGDPMSRTGNSANATMEDIVDGAPIVLTNCSRLIIEKVTDPTPAASTSFGYSVTQLDAQPINDAGQTAIAGSLVVPPNPSSVTIDNVLISPDYVVAETLPLVPGWTQQSLVCTSFDPVANQPVVRTLFPAGATSFPVAPGVDATCTITNIGPPTVTVSKVTLGGAGGPFTVDVGGTDLTGSTTAPGAPVVLGTTEVAPGSVTIGEQTPLPAGWYAGDLECTVNGEPAGTATATAAGAPTALTIDELASGDEVDCVQTNLAAGAVSVTKTLAGTSTDWSFDFQIAPVPSGQPALRTATDEAPQVVWTNLQPGVTYTVTEVGGAIPGSPGFVPGNVDCGNATSTVTPAPGQLLACNVTNTELADVAVTKTVLPATATGWAFDFTISPVPAGETATKTATSASPTVSWTGLVPGTTYTITEATEAGFVNGAVDCDGDNAFTPTPGQNVTCGVTNLELASLAVTKTVVPAGETGWSYGFTISPVPAGEAATKTATSASPTVSWTGLVPGTAYTVTEVTDSDLVVGTLGCSSGTAGVGTATVTPAPGEDVTCAIANTRIADIAVTKTAGAPTVIAGGTVTWSIQVTNNGPSTALDVRLVDPLPSSLTLSSVAAPVAWDCTATVLGKPGTVSCSKANMLPGETWSFTLTTTADSTAGGQSIVNVATVSTTTTETSSANNTDDATISVEAVVSLAPLPPTGTVIGVRLAVAALLVTAGGGLVLVDRRRRPA